MAFLGEVEKPELAVLTEKFQCKCSPRTCHSMERGKMLELLEERNIELEKELISIRKQQDEIEELQGKDCPLDVFLRKARLDDLRELAREYSSRNKEVTPDMGKQELISLVVNDDQLDEMWVRLGLKTTEAERIGQEIQLVRDAMIEIKGGKLTIRTCFDPDDLCETSDKIEDLDSDSFSNSTESEVERDFSESSIDLKSCGVAISVKLDYLNSSADNSNDRSSEQNCEPLGIGGLNEELRTFSSSYEDRCRNFHSGKMGTSEKPGLLSTSYATTKDSSTERNCEPSWVAEPRKSADSPWVHKERFSIRKISVLRNLQNRRESNAVGELKFCPPSDYCDMEVEEIVCVRIVSDAESSVNTCHLSRSKGKMNSREPAKVRKELDFKRPFGRAQVKRRKGFNTPTRANWKKKKRRRKIWKEPAWLRSRGEGTIPEKGDPLHKPGKVKGKP